MSAVCKSLARYAAVEANLLALKAASLATYSGVFTLYPLLTGNARVHHGGILLLREAARLADDGKLAPRVDSCRFDLCSVELAYAALTDSTASGKIVVDIE
jgi:NADPH:quinone reductase